MMNRVAKKKYLSIILQILWLMILLEYINLKIILLNSKYSFSLQQNFSDFSDI